MKHKNLKTNAVVLVFCLGVVYFFARHEEGKKKNLQQTSPVQSEELNAPPPSEPQRDNPQKVEEKSPPSTAMVAQPLPPKAALKDPKEKGPIPVPYVIDEGLAVVHGDVVIGAVDESAPEYGYVAEPTIKLWPTTEIPVYIQPGLSDPQRVQDALALFSDTVIRFVPYTNQVDALVFEESNGICKSYVGRIGGKQPIWISPRCGDREIAHEVMHALGFIHEQNRSDRDQFIQVISDNIDPQYKINFEKFSPAMMTVTGVTDFDFESLMLYPASMFARGGQATMQSKIDHLRIQPGDRLSPKDIERINKVYGR